MCPCPAGLRVDVATFRAVAQLNGNLEQLGATLMRILAIAAVAASLQSRVIEEDGHYRVDVQPRKAAPQIIVPV